MTKADIVTQISDKLGMDKGDVLATVETFMTEVKTSLESGDNVYLRGFGSFIVKTIKVANQFGCHLKPCRLAGKISTGIVTIFKSVVFGDNNLIFFW